MNFFQRILPILLISIGSYFQLIAQNLQINELMSSNSGTVADEDGDYPDWIEIKNVSENDINLADYFLSDDFDDLQKWQFPDITLAPQQYMLVFASDKDKIQSPVFWNTIFDMGDIWRYKVPSSELPDIWNTNYYDYSNWESGPSGIGFGDNDDNTVIAIGSISVFLLNKFSIQKPELISNLWLHMDYDDGFVAYLNGVEVARAGLGQPGSEVSWNQAATSHEALIVNGMKPVGFDISKYVNILNQRNNVLAIEVHNQSTGSQDLTAIPFLTLGSPIPFEDGKVSKYIEMPTLFAHTNFKLSSEGESVYLSTVSAMVDSVNFGAFPEGYSYGRNLNNPEEWGYFSDPTPNMPNNGAIYSGFTKGDIKFSPEEMFVSSSVQMILSGASEGEEIRYTLNGSEPTENSSLYVSAITINENTPVRAKLFLPGGVAGKIKSHTYIFDAPPTLPVVSIVTDSLNLWDNETGIYVLGDSYTNQNPYYGANFWEDWEKPASVEMAETDGNSLFSLNCGIKIFGAWSRAHPQKSLAVFFRKEYGDPVLENVQLFQSKQITEFKSFVLRNAGNDYGQARFRDVFMTDLVRDMDTDIAASEPIILYLNGEYWGHMNLREKINEDYLETNHKVDADSVDILELNGKVLEGGGQKYQELITFLEQHDLSIDQNYESVANMIELENFIDYEISQIYFNNTDWPGNNIKYWRPQTDEGKWRWIIYDTDFGFDLNNPVNFNALDFATATNGPGWPNPPWSTFILRKLLENDNFRNDFINRFADMMNTTFLQTNVSAKIDSIALIIRPEIQKTYLRWNTASYSYWNSIVQTLKAFGQNRLGYMKTHIKQKFSLPANHEVNLTISPSEAGNIKLNTLTISENNWKGDYFQNVPITLTANSYKGFKFSRWKVNGVVMLEPTIEINITKATSIVAEFEVSEDDGKTIVINEINYNSPEDYDSGDWIEIYNYGNFAIDLSGWSFEDNNEEHVYTIPENIILNSKSYFVFCRNAEDFSIMHPGVENFTGNFEFGLSSGGDAVRLFDDAGILVDEVYYGSESPWASEPNGFGPTLELINPIYENDDATSWDASKDMFGTPGRKNSIGTGMIEYADHTNEKILKIYPNPFSDETTITWENNDFNPMEIRIFTLDGRLVYQNSVSNGELNWDGTSVNHQRLKPGVYICNVLSEGRFFTEKLILTQ